MKDFLLWSLTWNNPNTKPPDGMPRTLCEAKMPRGEQPSDLLALHVLGGPYGIHISVFNVNPRRQLSEETKQSIRRKALRRRQLAKNPLFAESTIAAAIAANPAYYGEEKPNTQP